MLPSIERLNLAGVLAQLSVRRPVFHSEADLQQELAWQLRLADQDLGVRLEVRIPDPSRAGRRERVDLLLFGPAGRVALEVKYLTDRLRVVLQEEEFDLPRQGAQDIRGYDVLKDIRRVEGFVRSGAATNGAVLVVSNDASYWTDPAHGRATGAAAFRLYDGTVVSGERSWGQQSGFGTRSGRESAIDLSGEYHLSWQDYSRMEGVPRARFRYLLVEVR